MFRMTLMLGLSAGALVASLSAAAAATGTINGGGPAALTPVLVPLFSLFNASGPAATFGTYWAAGSSIAQEAFLDDDLSCDIDAVTGANGGRCTGVVGGANTVDYAASDVVLSAQQIATWAPPASDSRPPET